MKLSNMEGGGGGIRYFVFMVENTHHMLHIFLSCMNHI